MNPAMRRIPRAQRSIDQALSLSHNPGHRISPSPCRAAIAATNPLLRTTSASFATSASHNAIFKHDKKKHLAMVRRWSKRLHGDPEPIGAHVDPYDPTSPVRIAPEEQGEEVEVLAESVVHENGELIEEAPYAPATSGNGLPRIGGKEFVEEKREEALAARFTQLVVKPASIQYGFGPREPVTDRKTIVQSFHQAVVEIYTLKQAGRDLDVSKHASRGEYPEVVNFKEVKLSLSPSDGLVLVYPSANSQVKLLDAIENPPQSEPVVEELEEMLDEAEAEATETHDVDHAAEIEKIAETLESEIADLRQTVRRHLTTLASDSVTVLTPGTEATYGKIEVTDPVLKFALSKRLLALTGLRISDYDLYNAHTLSDILSKLIAVSKPKLNKVYEQATRKTALPKIPNVKLYPRFVSDQMKHQEAGRWKVIEYALTERGLPVLPSDAPKYNLLEEDQK